MYAPIKVKIKHPWWHWFFTNLYSWGGDGSYENHYCSKCKKCFHIRAEQVPVEEIK